jgi:hypothetical protein
MFILRQADHLAMLVDGEKLVDPSLRQAAADDSTLLLRRAIECRMVGLRTYVDVLLTKSDKLSVAGEQKQAAIDAWKRAKERFQTRFASRLGGLEFGEIAARPEAGLGLSIAHGLQKPFSRWVTQTLLNLPLAEYPLAEPPEVREFDLYAKRMSLSTEGGGR